jgi:hypothetical protein
MYEFIDYIWGRMVSPSGTLTSRRLTIRDRHQDTLLFNQFPTVTFDGTAYLVAWEDHRPGPTYPRIYTRRVFPESTLADTEWPIPYNGPGGLTKQFLPSVAAASKYCLVVWQDSTNHISFDIHGDTVPAVAITFDATAPSCGRHLARAPDCSYPNWAYRTNVGVFWHSCSYGIPVLDHYVGSSLDSISYPTIAELSPGQEWICAASGCSLCFYFHRADGTWKRVVEDCHPSVVREASLVLSAHSLIEYSVMGYAVYSATDPNGSTNVFFIAYDSAAVWYKHQLNATPFTGTPCSPSLSLTPGDWFHVVWSQTDPNSPYNVRTWYTGTSQSAWVDQFRWGFQPQWFSPQAISTPSDPLTEPSTQCFIEADGENANVVWRGPNH